MDHNASPPAVDLVRWAFSTDPEHQSAIEDHLANLGADVLAREGGEFVVTWDEPEDDLEEILEELWSINGAPFEVTQEEFQRRALHTLHHCDHEPSQEAA